jgi:ATP-dependent Clp protease ATP-binding subunit ClpA
LKVSVVSLDLARIVAGSRYRGDYVFQRVLDEVLAQPNIIFIDEIHNMEDWFSRRIIGCS